MESLNALASWLKGPEDNSESLADLGNINSDARVSELLQQYSVFLEYERLQDIIPSGMYVVPSFENPLAWHGVMFIRRGFYRGGVFKFILEMSQDYPESPPTLSFVSSVFHPLVDPNNGRVDISGVFPEWRAGRDYASFAIPFLHRAMLRRDHFAGSRPPLNPEAHKLFTEDHAEFSKRAAECAQLSNDNVYQNGDGNPLQFTKGPDTSHTQILDWFKAAGTLYDAEDRKNMFVDAWCRHYASQRAHVEVSDSAPETIDIPNRADIVSHKDSDEKDIPPKGTQGDPVDPDGYV